jgi:hypothetical protein
VYFNDPSGLVGDVSRGGPGGNGGGDDEIVCPLSKHEIRTDNNNNSDAARKAFMEHQATKPAANVNTTPQGVGAGSGGGGGSNQRETAVESTIYIYIDQGFYKKPILDLVAKHVRRIYEKNNMRVAVKVIYEAEAENMRLLKTDVLVEIVRPIKAFGIGYIPGEGSTTPAGSPMRVKPYIVGFALAEGQGIVDGTDLYYITAFTVAHEALHNYL